MRPSAIGLICVMVSWLGTTPDALAGPRFNDAKTLQRLAKKLGLRPDQLTMVRNLLNIPANHPHPCALELKEIDAVEKILTPDQRLRFSNLKEVKIARKHRFEGCCPIQ